MRLATFKRAWKIAKNNGCCGDHGNVHVVCKVVTAGRWNTSRGVVDVQNRVTVQVPYDLVDELVSLGAVTLWRS